jgi:acetyl esterase/lipase
MSESHDAFPLVISFVGRVIDVGRYPINISSTIILRTMLFSKSVTPRVTPFLLVLFAPLMARSLAADPVPNPVVTHTGVEFARPDNVPLLMDIQVPAVAEKPPLVMLIHGGGWSGGSRKNHRLSWLSQQGLAVASIEYRMSQEAVFPAQIHDCKGALRWLRAHADQYGYDSTRVIVAGDSAGGHLATLLGLSSGVSELEGETAGHLDQSTEVLGIIDYYGPADFITRAKVQPETCEEPKGTVYRLLGGKVSENLSLATLASPITHVTPNSPPLLIVHGDKDLTVPLSQSELLRDRYQANGREVQLYVKSGGGHGWRDVDTNERQCVLSNIQRWLNPSLKR